MRRLDANRLPPILLITGLALLVAVVVVWRLTGHETRTVTVSVTVTQPAAAPPPPTTTQVVPPPPPPPTAAFSWDDAGAMMVHPTDVDPTQLGKTMRAEGFGWAAVFLGDGTLTPPDAQWIAAFKTASGLPVGGWSVLREDPVGEATAAAQLVSQDGLAFYIADAEAEYGYTQNSLPSTTRYARSGQFVQTFRAAQPSLPAAISSYCRPDQHDLDWATWARAGFVFLPQAYVNDLGLKGSPAACVTGAAKFFPRSDVHPTVGSFAGTYGFVAPARYARLLAQAGTKGFSIYPAEVGMSDQDWQAYGTAISTLGIATAAS